MLLAVSVAAARSRKTATLAARGGSQTARGDTSLFILMRRRLLACVSRAVLATVATLSTGDVAEAQGRGPDGARRHRAHDARSPSSTGPTGGSAFSNALRIARSLHDERLVAQLLATRGMAKGSGESEMLAVIHAYEAAGTPGLAVEFLRRRIRAYPDERRTRILLARLLARGGQSRDAVAAYEEQIERFGFEALSFEEAREYALDLSRAGDVDAAYAVLIRARPSVPEGAPEYWIDVATLAWDRDDAEVALDAYERVYRLDPSNLHAGARLMTLLADAKRTDDAVRVAMAEHRRTKDPASALFAAHLLANAGDWRGLWAVVEEVERSPGALRDRAEYHLLKGDAARQLGRLDEAARAFRTALAVAPADASVRASALWSAIERGDAQEVRDYVDRFRDDPRDEPALWLPMAHGLAFVGRPGEALPWFSLQLRSTPRDARLMLDLADALTVLRRDDLAHDLRRRAVVRLPREVAAALHSPRPTDEERHLVESTALAVERHAGAPRAEPWMTALSATPPATRERRAAPAVGARATAPRTGEEIAADWYLSTGRPEYARRVLARAAPWTLRKQRLALAMIDEDPTLVKALLAEAQELGPEERAHALIALERDHAALGAVAEALERAPNGPDAPVLNEELARLKLTHRPNVRVGVAYVHVTGLDIAGPVVTTSHDALGGRLTYAASGSRMTDRSGQLLLGPQRYEAEAGAMLRLSSSRAVSELSAAVDWQASTPVARAGLFDQRMLTRRVGLTTELRAGSRIFDTGFLRLAAVRNSASLGLRYDRERWYATAEVEGREEHSRSYAHLAWEALATAEAGVKLVTREPHLSIGAQAQASQRAYPTRLPGEVSRFVSPNVSLGQVLPPSFQLVGGVVHLSRGDVYERSRPERMPFPRYDCEAAFGALLPDTDTALHLLCGASFRAPGGFTTLLAFYNRGIAGVRNNENAELALSYTLPF